jgi:ribosome-associated toxin RatA of RatAB toxin-antitoxin module
VNVLLRAERKIRTSPDAVYALSLDVQRFPGFFTGFGPIPGLRRVTLHAPLAVGSTRELEDNDGLLLNERITALEPGSRHAYTLSGLHPPLAWLVRSGHAEWTFAPLPEGTQVVWTYDFELTSPLAWPIASPLLHVCMRGAMQRCLDAISRALEVANEAPR